LAQHEVLPHPHAVDSTQIMPGASRLGDKAKAKLDAHGGVCCPHPNVQGPGITCSPNVCINGIGALTITSIGIHAACCGSNTWIMTGASGCVFVNGTPLVRKGDPTLHCGVSPGEIVDASTNVVDGSPQQKFLQEVAKKVATVPLDVLAAIIKHTNDGADVVAHGLEGFGVVADFLFDGLPSAVKGDAHGTAKAAVSAVGGAVTGAAATSACEFFSDGIATPICPGAGIVAGGVGGWVAGEGYDLASKAIGLLP
jgi:uncharacterized Zn-binding protein involved in type VI secretion